MAPFFKSLDDSKELPIVDIVISLSWGEGGGVVGTGVEVPIGVLLHEYSS